MELDDITRQKIQLDEKIEKLKQAPDVQRFLALEAEKRKLEASISWLTYQEEGWIGKGSRNYDCAYTEIAPFDKVRHLLED